MLSALSMLKAFLPAEVAGLFDQLAPRVLAVQVHLQAGDYSAAATELVSALDAAGLSRDQTAALASHVYHAAKHGRD
jgi:hypothetical protein